MIYTLACYMLAQKYVWRSWFSSAYPLIEGLGLSFIESILFVFFLLFLHYNNKH